jgi:hypothetical protein
VDEFIATGFSYGYPPLLRWSVNSEEPAMRLYSRTKTAVWIACGALNFSNSVFSGGNQFVRLLLLIRRADSNYRSCRPGAILLRRLTRRRDAPDQFQCQSHPPALFPPERFTDNAE